MPGEDGLVRVVKIKTATGVYKRAVTRLSLLFRPGEAQDLQESPSQPLPPGMCPDRNSPSAGQPTDAAAQQPRARAHHKQLESIT